MQKGYKCKQNTNFLLAGTLTHSIWTALNKTVWLSSSIEQLQTASAKDRPLSIEANNATRPNR